MEDKSRFDFAADKARVLSKADLSRKGSVDEPIRDLVEYINAHDSFYTTSSCSGRLIAFSEDIVQRKKNCNWLLVSHDEIDISQLTSSFGLTHSTCATEEEERFHGDGATLGYAFFKFEPFILHTMCKSLGHAQAMLQAAVGSGFRNSGITFGKKGKIMLAVRSTHSLEVPLGYQGTLIVTHEYLQHVVKLGNQKLRENKSRIDCFYSELRLSLESPHKNTQNGAARSTILNGASKTTPHAHHSKTTPHSPKTSGTEVHTTDLKAHSPNLMEETDLELKHLFS